MTVETIACNQCGAPLAVPDAAQFVTCNHCGASLAVRREQSVTYTEVVAKLVEDTSKLAKEVARLRYQNELARIDREWEIERRQYLVEKKDGPPTEPSRDMAILRGVLLGGAGVVAFVAAVASNSGNGMLALIGFFMLVVGPFSAFLGVQKANDFERARLEYVGRRGSISVDDFLEGKSSTSARVDEVPPLR
ncbi:MAG: hypothetical protein WD875_14150 [Pirellulales bacterium]